MRLRSGEAEEGKRAHWGKMLPESMGQDRARKVAYGLSIGRKAVASSVKMPEKTPCTLEDMSRILAHRMQSILTSIGGFAELLVHMLQEEDTRELALRILEGTLRLEYIVQDLRYFSRPEAPVLMPVPVEELVQRIQSVLVFGSYEAYRIVCEVLPEERVVADPRLFAQAMIALLQNAYEAHPREEEAPILIRIYQEAPDRIGIAIRNEGHIPEDIVPFIFRPFFTTKVHNMGLGLPIAQRIIEAHEGTLTLSCNNPEEGVIFTVQLPVAHEGNTWATYHEEYKPLGHQTENRPK